MSEFLLGHGSKAIFVADRKSWDYYKKDMKHSPKARGIFKNSMQFKNGADIFFVDIEGLPSQLLGRQVTHIIAGHVDSYKWIEANIIEVDGLSFNRASSMHAIDVTDVHPIH